MRQQGGNRDRSDQELVEACLGGDADAWRALIARYQSFIFRIPLDCGFGTQDAEDVFQNVCLKLCLHLGELRDRARLAAWLAAVARQECYRLERRRRPAESLDMLPELPAEGDVSDRLLREEHSHLLRRSLAEIPEDCRRLLSLLYGPEPVPYAAVAEQLGLPLGSIGPKRARCLDRLRKKMEEHGR